MLRLALLTLREFTKIHSDFGGESCEVDRLCGLVFRVLGYRSRAPGFDFRRYQIF
jgi:hypothetical protein